MDWSSWIPAGVLSCLSGALVWLLRTSSEKAIAAKFERELEALRAEHRRDEERLRAELRAGEAQIESLRNTALSSMSARRALVDKRKLEATEALWQAVIARSNLKLLATMAQAVKMDVLVETGQRDDHDGRAIKQFAEVMARSAKIDELPEVPPISNQRPFISPVVWGLYQTYQTVLSYPMLQLTLVRHGLGSEMLKDPAPIIAMVKEALPHQAGFIDQYGVSAFNFLVEELEAKLLAAIVESLEGRGEDEHSVRRAHEIAKLADEMRFQPEHPPEVPANLRQEPMGNDA